MCGARSRSASSPRTAVSCAVSTPSTWESACASKLRRTASGSVASVSGALGTAAPTEKDRCAHAAGDGEGAAERQSRSVQLAQSAVTTTRRWSIARSESDSVRESRLRSRAAFSAATQSSSARRASRACSTTTDASHASASGHWTLTTGTWPGAARQACTISSRIGDASQAQSALSSRRSRFSRAVSNGKRTQSARKYSYIARNRSPVRIATTASWFIGFPRSGRSTCACR